ncbi:MAG TPA: heparan-alpha-glucosaminide N-acetyltransferase domain-containing protein [Candidatus Anoxymicrobiaceae bacterium]
MPTESTQPQTMQTGQSELPTRLPGRVLSIDVLRGFALICLVLVHFMIYFGNLGAISTWPYFILQYALAGWGAAAFLMMMGMSQVLSSKKLEAPDNMLLFKRALVRGCYLFAIGLIMLALTWGPYHLWDWDILTLMGFATIVLFFCRFLPSWAIICSCIGLAAVTPLLRGTFDFATQWGGKFVQEPVFSRYVPGVLLHPATDYKVIWSGKRIVQGFMLSGYFPVLPWLLFPLIGFVLGRRIVQGKMRRDLPWLLGLAVVMIVAGLAIAYTARTHAPSAVVGAYVTQLSFYPNSFSMVIFQTGMVLLVYDALFYFYDVVKKNKSKASPIQKIYNRTSRFSLTFYFLQYLLIGWTLAVVLLFTGHYHLSDLMGSIPALLCGLGAVAFLEVLIYYWEKAGSKYNLEWFLGVLTRRLARPSPDILTPKVN